MSWLFSGVIPGSGAQKDFKVIWLGFFFLFFLFSCFAVSSGLVYDQKKKKFISLCINYNHTMRWEPQVGQELIRYALDKGRFYYPFSLFQALVEVRVCVYTSNNRSRE